MALTATGTTQSPLYSSESDLPMLNVMDDEAKPGTLDYAVVEWCEDRLKQGQAFVRQSIGYDKIDSSIRQIFSNENRSTSSSYVPSRKVLSQTRANLVAKTAEDLTALLTDTRIFWNYATHNPKYEEQARVCNKQAEDWYTNRLIDLRIADVIRYYCVGGTGFAHLYYSRRINDMMVDAVDPRHVFPIEPISYHTVQDALGVIIRQPRTPNWVKAEYKKDVAADIGDSGIFGWVNRILSVGSVKASGPLSKGRNADEAIPAMPTVFVNTAYINDTRINKTSKTFYMGDWARNEKGVLEAQNSWSYKVPPKTPYYPFKRMIVWTKSALLYDGPSPYWHAKFPLIKLTLNPWPKAWLGKAPLTDIIPLNDSLNGLLRVADDHFEQVAQPGVVADRNVSRAELNKFNSRAAGWQIRTNMASGKGIQVVYPNALDQQLFPYIDKIEQWMQKLSGTADVSQMAQLGQVPSDDTLDTIMKAMTNGVRLRSRIFEGFMKEFAEMYLYCIAQFYTLPKRMAKFGPGAVTTEDYDYDPGNFIPDDVPDGSPGDIASTEDALGMDDPRPKFERAKQMLMSFSMNYKVNSLLNTAAQQDRMEDLMLSKMGYLSCFTLWENLGKMNFAPADMKIPTDEMSRLQLQQQLGIGMVANAQGRKATNTAPPKLATDGSGDVTLQTS